MHVLASKELQVDDELLVSYLTKQQLALPVTQRMEELHGSFGFHCACERCRAERAGTA